MRETSGAANRILALLSKMMNLAERWGLQPDGSNPCRHVERYRERRRERFLSAAELGRLGEVLREVEAKGVESPSAIATIRLLVLTGARRSEILNLRWEHWTSSRACFGSRTRRPAPRSSTSARPRSRSSRASAAAVSGCFRRPAAPGP